jgi:hypothetical protein
MVTGHGEGNWIALAMPNFQVGPCTQGKALASSYVMLGLKGDFDF